MATYLLQRKEERAPSQWSLRQIQDFLKRPANLWIAKVDGTGTQILALVFFKYVEPVIDICFLETAHGNRRQGHMEDLLNHTVECFSGDQLWLEVHSRNWGARKLYKKLGFVQTGTRSQYYSDGGDCLGLSLTPHA